MSENIKFIRQVKNEDKEDREAKENIYLFTRLKACAYSNPLKDFLNYLKEVDASGRTIYTTTHPEAGTHLNLSAKENYLLGPNSGSSMLLSSDASEMLHGKNEALNQLTKITLQSAGAVKNLTQETRALVSIVRGLTLHFPNIFMQNPEQHLSASILKLVKKAMIYESLQNRKMIYISTLEYEHWIDTARFFVNKQTGSKGHFITENNLFQNKTLANASITEKKGIKSAA